MKKSILVINRYFLPVTAGVEINIREVYGYLTHHGWSVTVHTSTNTLSQSNVLPPTDVIRDIKVKRYPFPEYSYLPHIDWDSITLLALHNFDMFPHVLILAAAFVRKLMRRPCPTILLMPHGSYSPAWDTFHPLKRLVKTTYNRTLGRFLINHAVDAIRSVSHWETNEMIKNGVRANLITTISNGIEKDGFGDVENMTSPDKVKQVKSLGMYVVQLGRIHPVKNQHTAIKALARIPGVHFAIVGPVMDTNYLRMLKRLIHQLGLTQRVHFLGTISGVDKYYVLKHALALVHLATWESYCNAVHEAMSQGTVCIVSDIPALRDLTSAQQEPRLWIQPNDDRGLARAIGFVRSNRDKKVIQDVRERNRNATRFHSWEAVASQVERLYAQAQKVYPRAPRAIS